MGQKKYILIEDEENYSSDSNHGCLKCLLWIILILVGIIILLVEAIISIDGNSTGSEKQSNNNYKNTQTGTTSGSDIDEAQSRESDVRYDPTTQYAPTPTNSTRTDTNTTSGSDIDEAQSRESDLRYMIQQHSTHQHQQTSLKRTQTTKVHQGMKTHICQYTSINTKKKH